MFFLACSFCSSVNSCATNRTASLSVTFCIASYAAFADGTCESVLSCVNSVVMFTPGAVFHLFGLPSYPTSSTVSTSPTCAVCGASIFFSNSTPTSNPSVRVTSPFSSTSLTRIKSPTFAALGDAKNFTGDG